MSLQRDLPSCYKVYVTIFFSFLYVFFYSISLNVVIDFFFHFMHKLNTVNEQIQKESCNVASSLP